MKRCGGVLHYELMGGVIRVYRIVDHKRLYRFKCIKCGREGENDGQTMRCNVHTKART